MNYSIVWVGLGIDRRIPLQLSFGNGIIIEQTGVVGFLDIKIG